MNQYDALGKGLIAGLTSLGQGYLQGQVKRDAQQTYEEGTKALKDSYTSLLTTNMNMAGETPTKKTLGGAYSEPVQEQVQEPQGNSLDALLKYSTKLAGNPYGQPYLSALNTQYQSMIPSYQYKEVGNNLLRIDNAGRVKEVYRTDPKDPKKSYQLKGTLRINKDDNGNYIAVEQLFDPSSGDLIEKERKSDENEYNQFYQQGEYAPRTTGTRRSGTRRGSTTETTSIKEQELSKDLDAYRTAITNQDAEKTQYYQNKYAYLGMDIDKLNEEYEYQGNSPKGKRSFLTEKVRESEQINDAYGKIVKDEGIDRWYADISNASSVEDLDGKLNYYQDLLESGDFDWLPPQVWNKIWTEVQLAHDRTLNKRFVK